MCNSYVWNFRDAFGIFFFRICMDKLYVVVLWLSVFFLVLVSRLPRFYACPALLLDISGDFGCLLHIRLAVAMLFIILAILIALRAFLRILSRSLIFFVCL